MKLKAECKTEGCDLPAKVKGFCAYHYKRDWYKKNTDKVLAINRRYYGSHLDQIKESQKVWRESNKDRIKERLAEWLDKHPGYHVQKALDWNHSHPKEVADINRRYYLNHKEEILAKQKARSERNKLRRFKQ